MKKKVMRWMSKHTFSDTSRNRHFLRQHIHTYKNIAPVKESRAHEVWVPARAAPGCAQCVWVVHCTFSFASLTHSAATFKLDCVRQYPWRG